MSKINIAIVMPVYNDWTSFRLLVLDLAKSLSSSSCSVEIVAVDDCSSESVPERIVANHPIERITILELEGNVGHQRAIAIGLSAISDRSDVDYVAVMDSDGEDTAPELARLIEAAKANPNSVVVAQRAQRSEGAMFRLFYTLYISAFWLLTGRRINFGNFSLLPFEHLARLVHTPDIWNNFPATLIRAGLPLKYIPTARGTRYAGQSSMNLVNLVVHGLGAISVFSEVAFVRILLASTFLFVASMMGLFVVTVCLAVYELGHSRLGNKRIWLSDLDECAGRHAARNGGLPPSQQSCVGSCIAEECGNGVHPQEEHPRH